MIAIDATPLTETAPGGVRRALAQLVEGLAALPERPAIHLVAPGPLAVEVPPLDGLLVADPGGASPRGFRRRQLPALLDRLGARVLFEPFAATARVAVPVVAFVHELPHVRSGPYYSGFHMGTDRDLWAGVDFAADPATV